MARALQYVEIAQEHRKLLVATADLESPLPNRCTEAVRTAQLAEGLSTASQMLWYAQEENSYVRLSSGAVTVPGQSPGFLQQKLPSLR